MLLMIEHEISFATCNTEPPSTWMHLVHCFPIKPDL